MFKDTKEGKTHSYNDGCGEPAHNPKLPQHIEERFDKVCEHDWDDCAAHGEGQFCCLDIEHNRNKQIKSFIATILEEATKEAVDGVLEKMKPYTITGNRDMYCATFTIEQFKQILNYKSNKKR